MKSLGTGYRADAVRKARIVAAAFEQQWRDIEAHGIQPTNPTAPERPKFTPTPPALPADKTLRQAFELFRTDPAKQRTRKTDLHYLNLIELTVGLWGENRTIRSIDREASRELLDVLLWLPANAEKKFPKLSPLAASRMAKEKGLAGRLSPASVNGYMCKFRAVMNFCQNEGWIERNPAKGLQVIDRVRRRDKRLPFSAEQLRLIFDAPIYRGCVDDWAGYSTPGYAHPRRGRFWVPLIALFSGMRMNEICQLHVADSRVRPLIVARDGPPYHGGDWTPNRPSWPRLPTTPVRQIGSECSSYQEFMERPLPDGAKLPPFVKAYDESVRLRFCGR